MNPAVNARDPVERWVPLTLKLILYALLLLLFIQAATNFREYTPLQHWPFFLNTIRMFIFLPIHEAGHLLFSPFGRTLHILGGSFWQVMFMVLWLVIALRRKSQAAPVAAFFAGENLMDVSLYVRDAQFMALPLLGADSRGHDWRNLLTAWNALDAAGTIADILYYTGWILCAIALAAGVAYSIAISLGWDPEPSTAPGKQRSVEDLLDQQIAEKEDRERLN